MQSHAIEPRAARKENLLNQDYSLDTRKVIGYGSGMNDNETTNTGDETMTYRWQARAELVKHLRDTMVNDNDVLEERLADLSRSGSWLASEAKAAVAETSDSQWRRLLEDVSR